MIYHKRRDPLLLSNAITMVLKSGLNPHVIKYGDYNEGQYKQILSKCRFGIWIGVSESQGIGLQEALASGLPLIVCDVKSLFESAIINDYQFPENLRNFKPTSAPYFDERCGIIINDFSKLEESIKLMAGDISYYNPREYITENLSMEKQASELLFFFDVLKERQKRYFSEYVSSNFDESFKLSARGKLIYNSFLLSRKTKTMFRLIKNYFRKQNMPNNIYKTYQ